MNTILLRTPLEKEEIAHLRQEFPQYTFLLEDPKNPITPDDWGQIEILYGDHVSEEELELANELRWIHTPILNLSALAISEIWERGNIIITTASEENFRQAGEFVMAGIFLFGKNLLYWQKAKQKKFHGNLERANQWNISRQRLLQIGLGAIGVEVAKCAKQIGMTVWGVSKRRSFHPHCEKTFALERLNELLPEADVVVLCPSFRDLNTQILGAKEIENIKDGAILIVIGKIDLFDTQALIESTKRLRGILIDLVDSTSLEDRLLLSGIPNLIITPEVSAEPIILDRQSYHLFHYNLRKYTRDDFTHMKNRIDEEQT